MITLGKSTKSSQSLNPKYIFKNWKSSLKESMKFPDIKVNKFKCVKHLSVLI